MLIDTNIVSELMRNRPDARVAEWLQIANADTSLALSAITVDEIVFGLGRRPNAAKLSWFDRFATRLSILEVTGTIARRAGEMRATLSLRGEVRSQPDMLIAATAQVHALTLVTRNVRDFDGCGIAVLNPFTE